MGWPLNAAELPISAGASSRGYSRSTGRLAAPRAATNASIRLLCVCFGTPNRSSRPNRLKDPREPCSYLRELLARAHSTILRVVSGGDSTTQTMSPLFESSDVWQDI